MPVHGPLVVLLLDNLQNGPVRATPPELEAR